MRRSPARRVLAVKTVTCIVDEGGDVVYSYQDECPTGRHTAATIRAFPLCRLRLTPGLPLSSATCSPTTSRYADDGREQPAQLPATLGCPRRSWLQNLRTTDRWTVGYSGQFVWASGQRRTLANHRPLKTTALAGEGHRRSAQPVWGRRSRRAAAAARSLAAANLRRSADCQSTGRNGHLTRRW